MELSISKSGPPKNGGRDRLIKEDLLAMLSHELKAPLSTIKLYVQMVLNKANKHDDRVTVDLLRKADGQVTEMTAIIDNILDMSLIASGYKTLKVQRFDVSILIREVSFTCLQAGKTHYIHHENLGSKQISADRSKIKQVLQNLVSNAIKYSPYQSEITISSKVAEGNLKVSVCDQGIGISPACQEKIFDRFYRVDCNEVSNKKGYGIGLYLVQQIIHQHGGKINVESKEGNGSIFSFSLPVNR